MPDLLGPNPCEGCEDKVEPCRGPGYEQYESYDCVGKVPEEMTSCQYACGPYAAYAAKRELLEALKAGGVKVRDIRHYLQYENSHFTNTRRGPGHLIFIPEAQP